MGSSKRGNTGYVQTEKVNEFWILQGKNPCDMTYMAHMFVNVDAGSAIKCCFRPIFQ